MPLFQRSVQVIFGQPGSQGIMFDENFHIAFDLKKTSSPSANEGTVTITNLTESSIAKISVPGTVCLVKAGYHQDTGPVQFYAGTMMRIEQNQDGTENNVTAYLMDAAIPLRDAKISGSFKRGHSAIAILDYVAGQFGLPVRKNLKIQDRQMVSGFAVNSHARVAMNEICQYLGLEWSAQQNEIQIIKKGSVYADTAVVLSSATGMIGSPKPKSKNIAEKGAAKKGIKYGDDGVVRFTKTDPTAKIKERQMLQVQGYTVRSLFNPGIYPGALVQLFAKGIDGKFFRVEQCSYRGDTHEGDFIIEAEIRPVDSD